MKIKITLKDSDGVFESLQNAAETSLGKLTGLSESERESLIESRKTLLDERCETWIQHGEYVTIEIDTDANTATVCKVK